MPYNRYYVEIGRVVYLTRGKDQGKLGVIVDVVDQNRALVTGPGLKRKPQLFKHIRLTPQVLGGFCSGTKDIIVKKRFEENDVEKKFKESLFYKKLTARQTRENLNDFQRHKVLYLKKKMNTLINCRYGKLRKPVRKAYFKKLAEKKAKIDAAKGL
ncbi:60S ribosomal protein L14 [Galendromus occidentalis]|uniref:Large ribosomal subunit protein eL14 n=1 Tax=Galendromus occidentalis TaxID=34638 RepID=A0AAJ6VUX5_9ACAR|nr:60S ribosomal protein L14 [Galendromus occidentalis]